MLSAFFGSSTVLAQQAAYSQLRSLGVSSLFPPSSPIIRRSSLGTASSRSPSPPPHRGLDAEALLVQRNRLAAFSFFVCCMVIVWRVWLAPMEDEWESGGGAGLHASGGFVHPDLTPFPHGTTTTQALPPWPPLRPDPASHLSPHLVPITLAGYEDVWTVPPSTLPLPSALGVALLFHGCSHRGEVWASGGGGQAEIVAQLLAARLLPIALTSADSRGLARGTYSQGHGCWDVGTWHDPRAPMNSDSWGEDNSAVRAVIGELSMYWRLAGHGNGGGGGGGGGVNMPIVALGVSSGGAFVSQLALHTKVVAAAVYIMPLLPSIVPSLLDSSSSGSGSAASGGGGGGGGRVGVIAPEVVARAKRAASLSMSTASSPYHHQLLSSEGSGGGDGGGAGGASPPPLLLYPNPLIILHMPLDERSAGRIAGDLEALGGRKGYTLSKGGGSGSGSSSLLALEVPPQPLYPTNFTTHFHHTSPAVLSPSGSTALFAALNGASCLATSPNPASTVAMDSAFSKGGWWCKDAVACTSSSSGISSGSGTSPLWLSVNSRGEEVEDILDGFTRDPRLVWKGREEVDGEGGGGLCGWEWSASIPTSLPPPAAACGGGEGGRAEALRVLKRGLGEVLRESEGGHEMTSGHAKRVVEGLVRGILQSSGGGGAGGGGAG